MRASICLLAALLAAGGVLAQVPQLLSYQGKLLDDSGAPAPDGAYLMEIRFWDACSGGNLLLTDTHPAVPTQDGIYGVLLGSGTLTPGVESNLAAVFANHDLVCMGVSVEGDAEMVPRQQIVGSAYALRAALADEASPASALVQDSDDVSWTGSHNFGDTLTIADGHSLAWPHVTGSPPPAVNFRLSKFHADPAGQALHPNGESDEQWMVCYNCTDGSTVREDLSQHAWNQKIETNYFDGVTESLEYNWNYTSPVGFKWRPFAFRLFIDGQCSHDASYCVDDSDCGAGNSCDGANLASFSWNTRPGNTVADLELVRSTGRVRFSKGLDGTLDHTGTIEGTGTLTSIWMTSQINTENTSSGPTVFGMGLISDFASTTTNAQVSDLIGMRSTNTFSGAASGRTVTGQMIAVDAWNSVTQTGTGSTVDRIFGLRYKLDPTGQNLTVGESNGLRIEPPSPLAATDPILIERHFGVRIADQSGLGSIEGDALAINAQSSNPSPLRGNLNLQGGGWEDGHLRLENGHLWIDKSANQLRFKVGTPAAENDGAPLHSPPGTNTGWGGVYWGNSGSPAHDTGDEVCALAGMICRETYDLGSAAPLDCGSASHSTSSFLVFCY